ncbi:hypothetical protein EDD21DRAFT_352451 [Dissophora ornata]|nr:hypothetical protein EDD21DRAFT_352451 [Dissophora ornata]
MSSISSSTSISQITSYDPSNAPKIPGRWEGYFKSQRVMEKGHRVFRLLCLQPGCRATFAASSSSSSLAYRYKGKHRQAYVELCGKTKAVDSSPPSLIQTNLDMAGLIDGKPTPFLLRRYD